MNRVLTWIVLLGLSACSTMSGATHGGQPDARAAYLHAVHDAAVVGKADIRTNLVAIDAGNPNLVWNSDHTRILVVSWKSRSSYENYMKGTDHTSSSTDHLIWVTAAPQVQRFCRAYVSRHSDAGISGLNLRLKQYLGLDPDWNYDLFVEMWVKPQQMFRPCVDPEVDDAGCNLRFGDTAPAVAGIPDYAAFYEHLYFNDFRYRPGVPWTGLGYTYDWGNPDDHEGASEFILDPGASYAIKRTVPTEEYCKTER